MFGEADVLVVLGLVFLVAVVGVLAGIGVSTYWKFRGTRVITCPENRQPAAVRVDAGHAAATAIGRQPELRLSDCSRWPEKEGCGQECLRQIEAAPEGCLVRNLLTGWYQGKACIYCGKAFGKIDWLDNKPALFDPEQKKTVEWTDLRPEDIPRALGACLPACWSCHIAETFRRLHPELVTERDPNWFSEEERKKQHRRREWVN